MELNENPATSADEDSSDEELIEVWESIVLQQSHDAKQEKSQDGVVLFLHDISQKNATEKSEDILQDNFK